jgi:acyl dehydratase
VTRFSDVTVGDEIPNLQRVVTREDVKAYADAGGDQNPLHQDDASARDAGFDGIIAHGMFTMGHMAAAVTQWSDPDAWVARIEAQFRAPVSIGESITAGGRVRSIDPDGRAVVLDLWVWVERGGQRLWPIKRGEAEIRFPH